MHSGPITSVVVGLEKIYTAGYDKRVISWDKENDEYEIIGVHNHLVNSLALSNDLTKLASGSADHTIKIFDTHTNALITTLIGHTDDVESLIFSECDNYLISSSNNLENRVIVWELKTGRIYNTFNGHQGCINALWSYSNKVISAADDGNVFVWNLHTGEIINNLSPYNCDLDTSAGHTELGIFSLGTDTGEILLYDVNKNKEIGSIHAHSHGIKCLAFSPSGKYLLSAGYDHQIKIWDLNTNTLYKILPSHAYQWERSLYWSPDETYIYGGSFGIKYCKWDFVKGELLNKDEVLSTPSINKIDIDQEGNVVIASDDGIFRVNGKSIGKYNQVLNNAVSVSDDGIIGLWGDHSSQVHVFNIKEERYMYSLDVTGPVNIITYNKHDKKFLIGTYAGYIYRLNIEHGKWDLEFKAHNAAVKTLVTTEDKLITGASNGNTYIFDYKNFNKINELLGQSLLINDIAIDSSHSLIATVGRDRGVRVYSLETGCLIAQHFNHLYSIKSVTFNEKGILFAGDYWGNLSIWDYSNKKEPVLMKISNNGISNLKRYSDSIIASSWDGKIYKIDQNLNIRVLVRLFDQELETINA